MLFCKPLLFLFFTCKRLIIKLITNNSRYKSQFIISGFCDMLKERARTAATLFLALPFLDCLHQVLIPALAVGANERIFQKNIQRYAEMLS